MRFDQFTMHHVTGITIEDIEPVGGHTDTYARNIRIRFQDGSYTTIHCQSDKIVTVDISDLIAVQDEIGALKNAPFIRPEAD